MTRYPTPQINGTQSRLSLIEMLRDTPSGAVMAIVAGLSFTSLVTLLPLYTLWLELTKGQIAIVIALATGSSIAFQLPIGRLADKVDERWVLLGLGITCLLSSLTLWGLSFINLSWLALLVPVSILGGCVSTFYPVCVKFIFNQMDSDRALPAMSTLMILFGGGSIAGTIIASTVMEWLTPVGLFIYLLVLMVLTVAFMFYRVRVSRFPSFDSENIPYVITVQMIRPINANLDPRTDYLVTKISDNTIQTLANSIATSPSKTYTLIEQSLPYLEGFQPEEIVEALVMLKPRLAKKIIKAMLTFYPDNRVSFTQALGDLISLNKVTINRLLFEGLTYNAELEMQEKVEEMFTHYITPMEAQEST